jgi:hypothetical protein
MKNYIAVIVITLFVILSAFLCYTNYKLNSLEEEYDKVVANEKALLYEREDNKESIRALTISKEQLEYIQDSVINELNTVRKQLKIKNKELVALQNIKVEANKVDTLILRDTIFKTESFKLDTLLGDKWCSLALHLEYPNHIGYNATYNSSLNVVVHREKETVEPPKDCWFLGLFQKKHNITRVEVMDDNPYSNIKDQTFIIIE